MPGPRYYGVGYLLPILRDDAELKTRFGLLLVAAGAVGEIGSVLVVTLLRTRGSMPRPGVYVVRLRWSNVRDSANRSVLPPR